METQNNRNAPESLSRREEGEYNRLIDGIRNDDHIALEQLTRLLSRGVRFLLSKKFHSDDVESQLRDTLSALPDAIKTGIVNDFRQLLRFTLTTLKGQRLELNMQVECATRTDQRTPRRSAISDRSHLPERVKQIAESIARKMSAAEIEALRMYYVDGETQETTCSVRNLSADEFQRIKVKVKVGVAE
jgi:hypothetical protein